MLNIAFPQSNFKFQTDWNNIELSEVDEMLQSIWRKKMDEGIFRYKLNNLKSRTIDGRFRFVAQLNIDRATNRRKPLPIFAIDQPFDDNSFNFTKINENELMFRVIKNNQEGTEVDTEKTKDDYIGINVSPLEFGHCLLLPSLYERLPQMVTLDSIKLATDVILSCYDPGFRVAFNGLRAFASVNHLHFHSFYFNHQMLLETIVVKHLSGNCFTLEEHPSKGYVFQITSLEDITAIITDIYRLTSLLIQNNIAHNLFMTRGLCFERASCTDNIKERDCIRIYVWARTHSVEIKDNESDELFSNPAACELFGHLLMKTEESYNQVTEDIVIETLSSLTEGPFYATKEIVRQLFQSAN